MSWNVFPFGAWGGGGVLGGKRSPVTLTLLAESLQILPEHHWETGIEVQPPSSMKIPWILKGSVPLLHSLPLHAHYIFNFNILLNCLNFEMLPDPYNFYGSIIGKTKQLMGSRCVRTYDVPPTSISLTILCGGRESIMIHTTRQKKIVGFLIKMYIFPQRFSSSLSFPFLVWPKGRWGISLNL